MSAAKSGGLRVVLDTNVYFSAFSHPQGVPFQIWSHGVSRHYALIVSPAIMREVADVLRKDLAWPEAKIVVHLKLIAQAAEIITPTIVLEVIADDPDDDRILECAVAGRADLIVSGDRHLTRLKAHQGIGIARPADFLRTLPLRAAS